MKTGRQLFIAALIGASAPVLGQEPKPTPEQFLPFVPRQISPEVRLISTPSDYFGPAIGNIVVIEQGDGLVVVDSGSSIGTGRKAVGYIRSFTSKPVKAIVITHWHNDHPQGVAAFKEAWPNLRLISTPQTKAGMLGPELDGVGLRPEDANVQKLKDQIDATKSQYEALLKAPDTPEDRKERIRKALPQFDMFLSDFPGTYVIPPSETFTSRQVIPDSKVPVELLYLGRANTEGDAVAWLPKQKILATGDIVVSPVPFGFGSYPSDWIKTIGKIKSLGFRILIPGHGEPMTDSSYLDSLSASIATIRDKVTAAAKTGMSFEEVKEKVDLTAEAERFGTSSRFKAAVPSLWTAPMTVNAYKEAKGLPMLQTDIGQEPK